MKFVYILFPKNPNTQHSAESFYKILTDRAFSQRNTTDHVELIQSLDLKNMLLILKQLMQVQPKGSLFFFFFRVQLEYLFFVLILKVLQTLLNKNLNICYLMHEPYNSIQELKLNRPEKTISLAEAIKVSLGNLYNYMFGHLSDKVLLPSNEALMEAKSLFSKDKLYRVNLVYSSVSRDELQRNLARLKSTWATARIFSMLGTAQAHKNPQGFVNFARLVESTYPDKAQFIRAGRDEIAVDYDKTLITHFPGYITHSAKEFLTGATHFMIVPYTFVTQSGVITEALSYGKLLIINNIPPFAYLKELKCIFAIDFDDESSILACANQIFNMSLEEYEARYWEAVKYFQDNHSEAAISNVLHEIV